MNRGSACLFILMLLGAVVFSCENDVSKPGGGKEEPACGADLDTINFGKVRIGTFKDSCTTIGAVLSGVHIADTIVIRCPGRPSIR